MNSHTVGTPPGYVPIKKARELLAELTLRHGGPERLARDAKIHPRQLYGWRFDTYPSRHRGEVCTRKMIKADVIDKLLVGCGEPHRWFTDPELREVYEAWV